MTGVVVEEIRTDAGGHIRVRPARLTSCNNYAFMYRAATCVRWDAMNFELFMESTRPCSLFDEFIRIRSVVWTEYGDSLTVNALIVYENLPESVILLIRHTALQVD